MRRTLLVMAALCVTATACGSTLSPSQQEALRGASGRGIEGGSGVIPSGEGSDGGAGIGTTGTGGAGSTSTSGGTSSGGSATTGAGGSSSGSSSGSGSLPGTGTGAPAPITVDYTKPATGKAVDVGIMYIADLGAVSQQFGGGEKENNEAVDGQREYMKAAVDWMNQHGGLGGHKINLLYYGAQIAGSKTFEQNQSEMCAMMTEDHKVVASVISSITVTNTMASCMQKAKGLYVTDAGYFKSGADWQRLSYTVSPTEVDSEKLGRELAKLTIAKGLAKRGEQVGLVVYDAPGFRAAESQFTKVAAASGVKTMPYLISYANSTAELSNSIAAVQSSVLAFRSAGVKTVVSLSSGGMMGFFGQNADQQGYYPRYVLSSNDGPVNFPPAAKNNQMKGAIALGYLPTADVDLLRHPKLFSDPVYATCRAINKKFPAATEDLGKLSISQRICESLLLLQTAAKGYGGSDITGTTLRDGLRSLGSRATSGATYRTSFSPVKQWAPAIYRPMSYREAQNEFVYDGSSVPFS
jgi:ABC-type branched-subunit amino acid transport system substrate-binding protein